MRRLPLKALRKGHVGDRCGLSDCLPIFQLSVWWNGFFFKEDEGRHGGSSHNRITGSFCCVRLWTMRLPARFPTADWFSPSPTGGSPGLGWGSLGETGILFSTLLTFTPFLPAMWLSLCELSVHAAWHSLLSPPVHVLGSYTIFLLGPPRCFLELSLDSANGVKMPT